MSRRADSDEAYVLNLCDIVLGTRSLRQFAPLFDRGCRHLSTRGCVLSAAGARRRVP